MGLILLWGGAMVLAAVLALVTNIVANRMAAWVAQHTTQSIRHDLFQKISDLSCAQIDGYSIPSLEARLTSDTYNVHQMIGMMQRMGVRAPILLVGGVLITLTLDPVLTLVLVCTLPFLGVLVYTVSQEGHPPVRGAAAGDRRHGAHGAGERLGHPGDQSPVEKRSTSRGDLLRLTGKWWPGRRRRASPWP